MKRIIDKFLKLDNTKKLVISFVFVSFLVIFSITVFNIINENQIDVEPKVVVKEDDKSENETEKKDDENIDDKKEDNEDTETNTETNHSENTSSDTTSSINNYSNSNNSSSSTGNTVEEAKPITPEVEMINVSITIIGLNDERLAIGSVSIEKGQSVYDGLQKFANLNSIAINVITPGKYAYITSIAGLAEKQHGNNSGWMYQINGSSPNVGAGQYILQDGDQMVWYYVYS